MVRRRIPRAVRTRLAGVLLELPGLRNRHLALIDVALLPIAVLLAFALRLDGFAILETNPVPLAYALLAPLIRVPLFAQLGVYRRFWRYASVGEAVILGLAAVFGAALQAMLFFVLTWTGALPHFLPRSVPLIDAVLTLLVLAGPRLALRVSIQRVRRWSRKQSAAPATRVLIAGAGEAGVLVLRELLANPQTGLVPVGFVDDDRTKQRMLVHGLPVLGPCEDIEAVVSEQQVQQVIITMPSASGRVVRDIVEACTSAGIAVRTLPGMYDIVSGRVSLQQVREVRIEDLLRREPVETDRAQVEAMLRGKRVLVTGAGGSIGSELCRQILTCSPSSLILLGHGENSIFQISNELRPDAGSVHLQGIIADLRDAERLKHVFARYEPEIVFHAAAHKHVPLMEANPEDAVTNNVLGTRTLVEAAAAAGVEHFVMISSDKAVNPTNVMGATKRVAELIVQQAAIRTGRAFVAVRFGNVLGSRGSVVPSFQQQIAEGGPVTVTHPDMQRYFMTIPEAVQLVLQAATIGRGGEVFVLDMGQPVRIVDLAEDLIRLSGLQPGRDIDIRFTGLRPGEKQFEELFADREHFERTCHGKIFVCRNGASSQHVPPTLDSLIDELVGAARSGEPESVMRALQRVVPEYCRQGPGSTEREDEAAGNPAHTATRPLQPHSANARGTLIQDPTSREAPSPLSP